MCRICDLAKREGRTPPPIHKAVNLNTSEVPPMEEIKSKGKCEDCGKAIWDEPYKYPDWMACKCPPKPESKPIVSPTTKLEVVEDQYTDEEWLDYLDALGNVWD